MKKEIREILARSMEVMAAWTWPGNIRELQNFLERAVILTKGESLELPLAELPSHQPERNLKRASRTLNLREVERETILEALRTTNGRVSGPRGAAALLGVRRTTLQSRMRILHITLSHQPSEPL